MPTHPLGTLVTTLRRRPGVEAALVLGPDGLVIAAEASSTVDVEALAAEAPRLVSRAIAVGAITGRGTLQLAVLDLSDGGVIVSPLSPDASLLLVTSPACDRAALVAELRRHRLHLEALA